MQAQITAIPLNNDKPPSTTIVGTIITVFPFAVIPKHSAKASLSEYQSSYFPAAHELDSCVSILRNQVI
jgi:hypothetical protein